MLKRRSAANGSERRSSESGRGQSGPSRAARPLHLDVSLDKVPESVKDLLHKAKTKWLANSEVFDVLQSHKSYGFRISQEPPVKPPGGSLFLFNRNFLRFFRKDSHNWRKKADGKSVRETHEKLKVGSSAALNCYYAHTAEDTLQRRCYWLLDNDEGVVLVHYLNVVAGSSKTNSYRTAQRSSLGDVTDGAVSQESQSGHFDKEDCDFQPESKSSQALEDKKGGVRSAGKHTSKTSVSSASTRATAVAATPAPATASPSTGVSKRRRSISLNAGFSTALLPGVEATIKQEDTKPTLNGCGPAGVPHDLVSAVADVRVKSWDASEDLQEVPCVYLEERPQTWTSCGFNTTALPRSVSPCAVTSSSEDQQMSAVMLMHCLDYAGEPLTPSHASHSSYQAEPLQQSNASRTIFVAESFGPSRASCSNYTAESLATTSHHNYPHDLYHGHMNRQLLPSANHHCAELQRNNSHAALQELLNQPEFFSTHISRHNHGAAQLDAQDMRNFGLDVARSINDLFAGPHEELCQTSGLVQLSSNVLRHANAQSSNPGNVLLDVLSLTVPPVPSQAQQVPLEQVLMRHNKEELWMLPPAKKPRLSLAAHAQPSMQVDEMMWSAHLNTLSQLAEHEGAAEHNFEFWC